MAARTIKFEGKTYQFPDDATEQEIGEALASVHDQGPPSNVTNDPQMENPLTDAHISPPESGIGGFLNRKLASVKTALGGNKPERGSGSGAVDLVGGPAIGPLHVAHGVTQMPRHPVQGFNEAVGGVAQTAALPLAVAAPAAIPMSLPYTGGAKAGAWGLTEAGMDPDNAEALSNLVTMGVAGRGSVIRGTGRALEKVGGAGDIPELPFPSRTGAAAKMFNVVKRPIGQVGRKMANYGVPQAPNVYNGDASGPLPGEPDLPTPVKPDGAAHHNDVTDHGELDKLLDQVSQQPEVRMGRDPVQADRMPHYNDQSHIDMTPAREPNVQSQSPSEDLEGMAQRQGIDLGRTTPVKGADDLAEDPAANIPTPNSDTLLRAIKSAPGWPQNGLPDEPWDNIHAGDELSHALDTDPYNRPNDQQVQSPSYSGAERRSNIRPSTLNEKMQLLPPDDADALVRSLDHATQDSQDPLLLQQMEQETGVRGGRMTDDQSTSFLTEHMNRDAQSMTNKNFTKDAPFSRSVGGLSDAADNDDFQIAKSNLGPDASISQIALEAQRLKTERIKGKGGN